MSAADENEKLRELLRTYGVHGDCDEGCQFLNEHAHAIELAEQAYSLGYKAGLEFGAEIAEMDYDKFRAAYPAIVGNDELSTDLWIVAAIRAEKEIVR